MYLLNDQVENTYKILLKTTDGQMAWLFLKNNQKHYFGVYY